jgi:hypothetical protein
MMKFDSQHSASQVHKWKRMVRNTGRQWPSGNRDGWSSSFIPADDLLDLGGEVVVR